MYVCEGGKKILLVVERLTETINTGCLLILVLFAEALLSLFLGIPLETFPLDNNHCSTRVLYMRHIRTKEL